MQVDPTLFEQILSDLPDSVTIQDRDFRVIYQNDAMRETFGASIGEECFRVYEGRDQTCEGCGLQEAFATGNSSLVLRKVTEEDGSTTLWENSCFPLFNSAGEIVAGVEICRNITERASLVEQVRERNTELERLNREYRTLLEHLPDYIVRYDSELRRTYVNPTWERAAGLTAEEVVGIGPTDILKVSRPVCQVYLEKLQQAFATGQTQFCEFEWENASGEQLFLDYKIIPEFDTNGRVTSVLAVGRDLTERKQNEDALRYLNRKLRAVSNCNQVLLRAEDEQVLLDEICRIICEEAGYPLTWVGFAKDDAEKTIEPVTWAGQDSGYVANLRLNWDSATESGLGPAGTAICNGETILVQDIATDPRMIPWRESALQRGYRSVMALPLKEEGKVFAVLVVYSEKASSINPDEVELLEGLAANLAYGITVLRGRSARQEANRQVSLLSYALNSVHEAAYLINDEACFYYVNDEACRALGYNRDELLGLRVMDIDPDFPVERWKETLDELKQRRSLTFETRHQTKDGRIFPVEIHSSYLEFEGKEFDLALARDITERKLMEEALFFVAQRGWLAGKENFFNALAHFLGESLDIDYVLIDRLDESPDIAETLAVYAKGAVVPNMRYALKGTPCENVMGREMCVYQQGVQQQFPEDALLVEMGVDSYIGIPLWDSFGRPIGLIALMDSQPIPDVKSATQLLQLVATRAAAELERERSDRILRARELEFRTLAENSPDYIARYDADCRILYINPTLEKTLGGSASEMLGKTTSETSRIDEAREYQEKIAGVLASGEASEMDLVLPDRGEGVRYHNVRFVAERGDDGKITGVLAIGRDITERKQSEEELGKLSQAIEQSPVSIVITDTSGQIEFVNSNFSQITGYSREEALGQNPRFMKSGETSAEEYQKLWLTISAGGIWSGEFHNRKKDGELFWEHATIAPVRDAQQHITHFVAVKEDITERKRLEEQLHQAQKLESVGQLAGGVAHDFNNMLAVILGRTQMALKKVPPDQPLFSSLQEIHKAAERSADLTRQLLAFARKQVISPKTIELNDAVSGMLKMLSRLIGEDIDLAWIPENKPQPVKMDPTQLDQILVNLCVNARDAIAGVGKITIETHRAVFDESYCTDHAEAIPGDYVLLIVSDNGPGMNRITLDRIFEPFFTTKGIGSGTGLGLATVYGIVKQNNGFINVYSEPEQGTSFRIYLPRLAEDVVPDQEEPPVAECIARGDETILLVEDELSILSMTQQMLEACGYRVIAVHTPAEAIREFKENTGEIHLLITDVVMPGMNGRELAKKLNSDYPNAKCLFMSGYPTNVIVRHGVLEEGVHFLQKPFALETLAKTVREVLDEPQKNDLS